MDIHGHYPEKIISDLQIKDVPEKYSELIEVKKGKKVFFFSYYAYDKDQNMVEYTLSYNKPEFTSFQFSTKRM
jgi:GntR family transcriptional regulator